MTPPLRTAAWLALVVTLLCSSASHAGLVEGLAALAKGDYPVAVMELRPLADSGNAEAQYRIGTMYELGRGYPVDKAQGIAWLRKAADQGYALAQFKLGVAYENGEGVTKDPVLAYAMYAIAARSGHKESATYRDDLAAQLSGPQALRAQAITRVWKPGQPMPTGG